MKKIILTLSCFLTAGMASAEIKYLPLKPATKGENSESYKLRPDLARVEHELPLSSDDLSKITPQTLRALSQEQLDQIYARLGSGPIPEGDFIGTIIVRNPLLLHLTKAVQDKVIPKGLLGILPGLMKVLCRDNKNAVECLGEFLWSGKRFYPPNQVGEVLLRNAINPAMSRSLIMKPAGLGALVDPIKKNAISEPFGNDKTLTAENHQHETHLMLFPAHVFCGLSFFDTRRESIIIDYANGDDFKPFIPEVDGLIGRNGSWIRDEIRMIRPGLYLGRAYVDRMFLLNFVLQRKEGTGRDVANRNLCWAGKSWQ